MIYVARIKGKPDYIRDVRHLPEFLMDLPLAYQSAFIFKINKPDNPSKAISVVKHNDLWKGNDPRTVERLISCDHADGMNDDELNDLVMAGYGVQLG